MKRHLKKNIFLWGFCVPVIMVSFMNCSQFESTNNSGNYLGVITSSVEEQNYTVQSAEQLARSMASVTGVTYVDSIVNEYNSRKALMTTNYSISSVNAPMLVSVANLGSQYCEELLKTETPRAINERSYFKSIDFTKAVSMVDQTSFDLVLTSLGQKFWGRDLSSEERKILNEAKQEFIQAIPSNSTNSAAQTRALMLSTCTGMLASLEFILI